MSQLAHKILFALIIPILLCNLSVNTLFAVARDLHQSGHPSAHQIGVFDPGTGDHCPVCPEHSHRHTDHNADHSHTSCEHHSSLYLGQQAPLISYHPTMTMHVMAEPYKAIPEVYLDKFIPPENLA